MNKNPNKPRARRLLLEAVGVGTSVALFGCSSTVEPMTGVLISDAATGLPAVDAHGMGSADAGTIAEEGGPLGSVTNDAVSGTSVPEEAGSHGIEPEDAGPMGKVAVDAAGQG